MKASDLRIGNYYLDIDDNLTELSGYELYQMTIKENTNNLGVKEFQPIPLTEEWILKLGFEESDLGLKFELNDIYIYTHDGVMWYNTVNDSINIEFVHQLQNLYFALMSKELETTK